jgi:hypothetical protein
MTAQRAEGEKGPEERKGPHIPHQATLFLEGKLERESFSSPRLPRGCRVSLAGHALRDPEDHQGEGVFTLWPRTDEEGRLSEVLVALKLKRPMEGPELQVHGLLLHADRRKLVVLIQPKVGEAFRLVLPRARGFTARLEPKKAYRLEGGLRGGWLVVERAYPLGKWDLHRKGKRPAPEAIEGDRNPYLEEGRGPKAQEARPEPQPEPEPKPEPRAQT